MNWSELNLPPLNLWNAPMWDTMNDVNGEIDRILDGEAGVVSDFPALLSWFQQNYILVDVNMNVQKPSVRQWLFDLRFPDDEPNNAA